ncbi:MAG TPA: carboxypeptidase regulatory-like domain-containing protein [Thermoanaerobaculia bacterium]|jgi:plastocyanin
MSFRKYLQILFALTLMLAIACGGGKEVVDESELGEDDGAVAENTDTAAASGAAPAAAAPVVADAATIAGLVKFEGTPGKGAPLQMGADPYCHSQHQAPVIDESMMVGAAGELANVIVYVKNAPAGKYPPPAPAVLDQKGCQYIPHVTAVQVGQPVQIKNSDATLHNVHAMPAVNSGFNEGQPVQGMVSIKKFDKVEMKPFRIKCDVHGWMNSFMAVLPHPYHGVSGSNGSFNIANLPPGNYTLVAWHEKLGEQEQQVTVGAKEQKQVTFTFKG